MDLFQPIRLTDNNLLRIADSKKITNDFTFLLCFVNQRQQFGLISAAFFLHESISQIPINSP